MPNTKPVWIPKDVDVHYEIELAVILKSYVFDLSHFKSNYTEHEYEELWKNLIAGYAIGTALMSSPFKLMCRD